MCMIVLLLVLLASVLCAGSQANFDDGLLHESLNVCSQLIERREWRMLGREEKANWIASVKCLASVYHQRLSLTNQGATISGTHSLYDDFAIAHAEISRSAHKNSYFLVWHRWFLYLFDKRLRDTCGYVGPTPFWDWSLDVADLFTSPVFDRDPVHGLGGSGDCTSSPESDCLVPDGSFAPTFDPQQFSPILSFPVSHTLRRNLSLYLGEAPNERPHNSTLTPTAIANHMQRTTPGNFSMFQHAMEQMHNHIHNFVGGDLAGTCPKAFSETQGGICSHGFTPNDPLFWLHHAQLDRLWSIWQNKSPENYYVSLLIMLHQSDTFDSTIYKLSNLVCQAFAGASHYSTNLSAFHNDPNTSTAHMLTFDRLSTEVPVNIVFDHFASPLCYYYEDVET